MPTRGHFGFFFQGKFLMVYVHLDSYPAVLGVEIVNQIKSAMADGSFANWRFLLSKLKSVDQTQEPSAEDLATLQANTGLKGDFYQILSNSHETLADVLKAGFIANEFADYLSWEEYAYVVNFDTNTLDYYVGDKLKEVHSFISLPDFSTYKTSETDD